MDNTEIGEGPSLSSIKFNGIRAWLLRFFEIHRLVERYTEAKDIFEALVNCWAYSHEEGA